MEFDRRIDRRITHSRKWMIEEPMPLDVIPLWVADMDFEAPKTVIEALKERVDHGIFGYTVIPDTYYEAVKGWMKRRHNFLVNRDWITIVPGIVTALNVIVQAFTSQGDAVIIQRPVYHPFSFAVENNGRKLVNSPLVINGNRYEMNFEDFEQKIIKYKVKLFILCSPHNPVGRVWSKDELKRVADLCLKHGVLMVVDEIHHDLIYKGVKHTTLATLDHTYSMNTITCTAPSKTFNLAGLQVANVIIENENIRKDFQKNLRNLAVPPTNIFGRIGCEVAYQTGDEWLDHLMDYLEGNKNFVKQFIEERLPLLRMIDTEATYLLWIDFRGLGLNDEDLEHFLIHEAKLWLNKGVMFGEEGRGYARMNIGCPRTLIEQALINLEAAINNR